MAVPAWAMLGGLPAWQLTELPRVEPRGEDRVSAAAELAREGLDDRMLALASACGEGAPIAFGWVRERAEGPVRVIAAGDGMRAEGAGTLRAAGWGSLRAGGAGADAQAGSGGLTQPGVDGQVKLGYPSSGARGVALPAGGLVEAFAVLPWWVPIAVTADALLAGDEKRPSAREKPYGHGVLRSWDDPFGWLVLAVPADEDRHEKLLNEASLAQLTAERHDSPRAQLSARRWKARHDELREAATHGLWDIWLLAGAADKRDLMRVAGLVASSLHPRGMPFGLKRLKDRQGSLPDLLGAADFGASGGAGSGASAGPGSRASASAGAKNEPARGPGTLAQEVLGMYGGQAPQPGASGWTPEVEAPRDGASRWAPGAQAPPSQQPLSQQPPSQQQQVDANGFPAWAPTPDPGWGPGGGRQNTWTGGQPGGGRGSAGSASAVAPGGLAPEFPDPEAEFPCAASSRLLSALAVPPSREVPGVRFTLEPDFDVTPETTGRRGSRGADARGAEAAGDIAGGDDIALGTILDVGRSPAGELVVPRGSLNRHTFVCGATGAGKSQTVRHLLESATEAGIPWLVIEPAKAEYRLMAARMPGVDVVTIRPGDLKDVPAGINPLEPAAGPRPAAGPGGATGEPGEVGERFQLQAHADLVRALFLAAFQADEPFPQVLAAALTRCYTEAGWDMLTGKAKVEGAAYPTLADLQAAALQVVEEIGYSQEITDNVRGFVSVRIGSLMGGTTGRFLHGGFPLNYEKLLSGNVVLEIEDCGDDTDKAFLTGAVLVRLTEHLRMRARAEGRVATELRHLTVVEEAHRLLRQPPSGEGSGPAAHAVEMFAGLLAEIRAYGEGLVIAEQIPSKLIPDVIKNTAVKVVHRLPAQDDRDAVGATMNLTEEQSRYLVTLRPGEAAVFTDGMDYPVLAKMPDGSGRERGTEIRSGYVGGLVGGLSQACPSDCRDQPCDLGRMAAAQRDLAGDRMAALWAELVVAAHLAGWPSPGPTRALRDRLEPMDSRTRDCVIARAIDASVAARTAAFSDRVAGPLLAAHVGKVMRGVFYDDAVTCDGEESEWHAPALFHGDSGPGDAFRDSPPLRDVVFGKRSPSLFERAARTWTSEASFSGRLSTALGGFPDGETYARFIAGAARL